jgi:dTDP-4-amino-4,6-dideoxygalactose transaminase
MTGSRIRFTGLHRQYANIKDEILDATNQVLSSGRLMNGPFTKKLEHNLCDLNGMLYALTCHSGTQALECIADYRHGQIIYNDPDEKPTVAIPTLTFPATANAFISKGWDIKFLDTDATGQVPANTLKSIITDVDLIVVVGLYGDSINNRINQSIGSFSDSFVEDAAQHWTSSHYKRRSMYTAISFDPTKNLPSSGNGGAVLTDDEIFYSFAKEYFNHGKKDGEHNSIGTNSRMSELEASHLLVRMAHLFAWEERRTEIATYYNERFRDSSVVSLVEDPEKHGLQKYVVRVENRNGLKQHLADNNIETKIHYERPLHEIPIYSMYDGPDILSTASSLSRQVLSLPMYPELTDAEVETIASQVLHYAEK